MNKQNRKELRNTIDTIREALDVIETIAGTEEEKFYNLPDSLQMSGTGMKLEKNAEALNNVRDEIDSALDAVAEVIEN